MSSPLVSIIIPVYNTGSTAKKLAEKLLKDSYKNIEIIAVDDGSTDDSEKVLQGIQDERMKVFRKVNGGASSARNFGIKKSSGEYTVFIDSDDDIAKDYIKKLVDTITKTGAQMVTVGKLYRRLNNGHEKALFVNMTPAREKNETLKCYILRLLNFDGRIYAVNNQIFITKIIKENNLTFDESQDFAEDTRFVLDYLKHTDGKIEFIYEPLYIYNFGTETSIVKESSLKWENWEKLSDFIRKWVGEPLTKEEAEGTKRLFKRWKVSHALAVARSSKKFSEKTKFLNPFLLIPAQIIVKFRR